MSIASNEWTRRLKECVGGWMVCVDTEQDVDNPF